MNYPLVKITLRQKQQFTAHSKGKTSSAVIFKDLIRVLIKQDAVFFGNSNADSLIKEYSDIIDASRGNNFKNKFIYLHFPKLFSLNRFCTNY